MHIIDITKKNEEINSKKKEEKRRKNRNDKRPLIFCNKRREK